MIKKITGIIKGSCFVKSFKRLDKRLFWVAASEIMLVIGICMILIVSSLFLKAGMKNLGLSEELAEKINTNPEDPTSARSFILERMMNSSPEEFKGALRNMGLNIALSLAAVIVCISFFKSLGWSRIKKERFTAKFFARYLLLFITWNAAWLILLFIISSGFKASYAAYSIIIVSLFYAYFSFLVYPIFIKSKGIAGSFKKTLRWGFINLYRLILPVINILLMLQLVFVIMVIFYRLPFLAVIALAAYLLFYVSWVKFYMYEVVKDAE
ncbi:hypothetical protein KY358_01085 [Candidatus Woesearchaeota archaeon]|nr:hypothetical protein [Candidatus Woesearchaeota archaeon]